MDRVSGNVDGSGQWHGDVSSGVVASSELTTTMLVDSIEE